MAVQSPVSGAAWSSSLSRRAAPHYNRSLHVECAFYRHHASWSCLPHSMGQRLLTGRVTGPVQKSAVARFALKFPLLIRLVAPWAVGGVKSFTWSSSTRCNWCQSVRHSQLDTSLHLPPSLPTIPLLSGRIPGNLWRDFSKRSLKPEKISFCYAARSSRHHSHHLKGFNWIFISLD